MGLDRCALQLCLQPPSDRVLCSIFGVSGMVLDVAFLLWVGLACRRRILPGGLLDILLCPRRLLDMLLQDAVCAD